MTSATVTYVYCLVSAPRKPSLSGVPRGVAGAGPARLLDVSAARSKRWLVVADVPLARYGEQAIAKGLKDLDWVSHVAVAHEAVVESFIDAPAVLPMKLFTIFSSDERAREFVAGDGARIARILKRVAGRREWGVRVTLDRARAAASRQPAAVVAKRGAGGAGYLAHKKARRDATAELAQRARETATALYDDLAPLAADARRRPASELPADGGPLLLDAVFLIPMRAEARFRRAAEQRARSLGERGYDVVLSGPWPPYGFLQD